MITSLATLISLATAQQLVTDEQKCRVLSLSGGGSKGAYEVGAIHSIVNSLEAPHNHYDVVSGVSVGAINAAGVALFDKDHEKDMADYLVGLWSNLTSDQVWQWWPSWCPVDGLTHESGFLDNSPLFHLLSTLFEGKEVHKRVFVSANDANSGSYIPMQL